VTMRRLRTTSSRHRILALQHFSIFGVLMTKGKKRVIFLSVFHSSVCGLYYRQEYVLCVASDTLMACKTYYVYPAIFLCLGDYFVYLSISYVYEMRCVVVPLYTCYIVVILYIFTICHTILSHDYAHPFRHPRFIKLYN
jgi:hypothetical protein